jgi:hypothetical protein
MRRAVLLTVAGIVLVAVAAAGVARWLDHEGAPSNANGSVSVRDLGSIVGEYVSINDSGAPARVLDALPIRLVVEKDRVIAYTGCNSLQGGARVHDDRLVMSDLAMTEIGCPPDVAAQEQWVLRMLEARPRLERSGPYLSLSWDEHWLGLSSDPVDRPAVSPSA